VFAQSKQSKTEQTEQNKELKSQDGFSGSFDDEPQDRGRTTGIDSKVQEGDS
jgi:hypothetical protein